MEISIETLKEIIAEAYTDGLSGGEDNMWGKKPRKVENEIKEIFKEFKIKES